MSVFDVFKRLLGGGSAANARTSPSGETLEERRHKPRMKPMAGTRVLVVDDSTVVVTLLRRMLEQGGFEPIEAFDAESGIQAAREQSPALIFLDIVLPGMNGFQALRILRKDPYLATVPIIMMSGNEQATEQFWAQKIGADDFMKKPFSRSEVFRRIERLLAPELLPNTSE
jgi:twitching motility two-component system response regulator PilH